MAYTATSFSYGEQPSAAKWNQLGSNDAAFNDGTAIPSAGAKTASVATAQTTTSVPAADLATVGPTVTATIGATGMALLIGYTNYSNSLGNEAGTIYYVVSGATTVAATELAASREAAATFNFIITGQTLVTGLNSGSNTFKMQYSSGTGGTGTFTDRKIIVIPL